MLTVLVAGLALVVLAGPPPLVDVAQPALVATLIAWPVGMLAYLAVRWLRAGDLRYAALAAALLVVSVASAVGGSLLVR